MIHYSTGGRPLDPELPLLVFVHGAGFDHTTWSLQARYFATHGFSVMAVDLPGHGKTPGPPCESITGYTQWLGGVIADSGHEAAHVVGHSMGALIGLTLAATLPDVVASLALLGVSSPMPVHPDLLDAAKRNDHLAFELVASWSHARPAHAGAHPTPGLWMMGSTVRLLEKGAPDVLYTDLAACNAFDGGVELAERVRCEVLFLLGEGDVMTRPSGAVPLITATQWSQTVTLPGAGHLAMMEQPDAVIDALEGFLSTVLA